MILIIALCTCCVLINALRNYTLRSNNCALGLKSQFAIITRSHLKPVLRCICTMYSRPQKISSQNRSMNVVLTVFRISSVHCFQTIHRPQNIGYCRCLKMPFAVSVRLPSIFYEHRLPFLDARHRHSAVVQRSIIDIQLSFSVLRHSAVVQRSIIDIQLSFSIL